MILISLALVMSSGNVLTTMANCFKMFMELGDEKIDSMKEQITTTKKLNDSHAKKTSAD